MSDSVYERIHAKLAEVLIAGLEAIYGENEIRVERNRDIAFQDFPGVNILDGDIQPQEPESTGVSAYVATVVIEGYVQAAEHTELGPLRSALLANVVKIWKADRKLDGLSIDITEVEETLMPAPSRQPNQSPVAGFSHPIRIFFWTEEDDPFLPGPG